ncbi:hypothetical protein GCM10027265_37110 [Jatrophihabitans fulvus]
MLARLVWVLLPLGVGVNFVVNGVRMQPDRTAVTWFCLVFFGVLCARLVLAARRWPARRGVFLLALAGLLLWCVESASLQNASPHAGDGTHLAAGELLFLVSYLLVAMYLVLDLDQRPARTLAASLDAAIVCGGSACAAGPFVALVIGGSDLASWVALLYPVLDLALAGLVVAQVALRVRGRNRRSAQFVAGFVLLCIADATFANRVAQGSTGSSVLSVVLWGAGFALFVGAAGSPRPPRLSARPGQAPAAVLAVSSIAAILVLLAGPSLELGMAVELVAAATLIVTGTRLIIALRDANTAASAIELSQTDDLTGLPNRRAINQRLTEALAAGHPFGLMIMDLDGFKDINDTLGHDFGDTILRTAAARMRDVLPRNVLVARLGGDEFALVVPTSDELELFEVARLALDEVQRPDSVDGFEIVVSASIGIATRTEADTAGSALLRRADIAMYQAKERSTGISMYEPETDEFTRRRLRLVEEVRKAITHDQFRVHYQPQIDATDQSVVGIEALVRWHHPSGTIETPQAFLSTVRHAGLMPRLSEAVIRHTVADMRRWRAHGWNVRVALNCAPPELLSGTFVRQLLAALEGSGLSASDFVLEVTEDSFVNDPERARTVLADVRAAGLQVAVDDYGTGFSSLAYLRHLPVEELKIDRSFVGSMIDDPRTATIVDSTVRLAHALGLRVVAEGVEDAATSAALIAMGVDVMQGYHFTRPLPADVLETWAETWTASAPGLPQLTRQTGRTAGPTGTAGAADTAGTANGPSAPSR